MLSTTCSVPKGARLETTGPNCTSFRATVVLMGVKDLRSHLKPLSELHLVTSSCRTLRRCRQLSAGQTLSGAAAKTPPEEQSLQAGEPRITMLGFLHFMLSYSPLSPSFHSLASQRASKGRVTLPHPLFAKHAAFPPPPGSTVFFHLQTPNLSHLGPNATAPYLLAPRPRLRKQEAPGRVPSVLAAACFVCTAVHLLACEVSEVFGLSGPSRDATVALWCAAPPFINKPAAVYLSFFWVVSVLRTVMVQFSSQK